ncbi:MAG: SpoIID/LytB domain-containing protein [Kineosporiaceae bacterium]
MSASERHQRGQGPQDPPRRHRRGSTLLAAAAAAGLATTLLTASEQGGEALPGLESVASTCPAPGGARIPDVALPKAGDFAFMGHGWGHGMGMSQYGAQGAARLGCSYQTILSTYYRGSHVAGRSMTAPVVLALLKSSSRSTLQTVSGTATWGYGSARVAQPKGVTWQVKRVAKDAHGPAGVALLDERGRQRLRVPVGGTLVAAHTNNVVRLRSFTGSRTSASSDLSTRFDQARFAVGASSTTVTEAIVASGGVSGVEKYLWGLAEIPASWPAAALRAQAVAARSYLASKYSSTAKAYVVSVTTSDQVYGGYKRESTDSAMGLPWHKAVDATRGQVVLTSANQLVTTMYSSSMGGYTEDRSYVYGSYGISYLKAVDDSRWDLASDNPYRSWAVGVSKATLASKLGLSSVTGVSVAARGSSSRLGGVTVTGVKSGKPVTLHLSGSSLRSKLGLKSPGFVVRAIPHTPSPAPSSPSPAPSGQLASGGQAIVGDFDGNGRDDIGWYKSGSVAVRTDGGRVLKYRITNAPAGTAVVGDFNGDGKDSVAVFAAGGHWYLRDALTTGTARVVQYGLTGDVPVVGNWSGRGRVSGIGVVRKGAWFLRDSATPGRPQRSFSWGPSTARAVAGDWNGGGPAQPGQRYGSTWRFALAGGRSPRVVQSRSFGRPSDAAAVGRWPGQRRDSIVIVRGCTFSFVASSLTKVDGVRGFCG